MKSLLFTLSIALFSSQLKGQELSGLNNSESRVLAFTAVLYNQTVQLKWITGKEIVLSHFTIERSSNGRDFKEIAIIMTSEDQKEMFDYKFDDKKFTDISPVIHYRLRLNDKNGHQHYSGEKVFRLK